MKHQPWYRWIALLFALCSLTGCTAPTASTEAEQENPPEVHTIVMEEQTSTESAPPAHPLTQVLDVLAFKGSETIQAAVQDVDGDGAPELFVLYEAACSQEQWVEIWTYDSDGLQLFWAQPLCRAGQNAQSGVRRITLDGMDYLCVYSTEAAPLTPVSKARVSGTMTLLSMEQKNERNYGVAQHRLTYSFTGWDARTPDALAGDTPEILLDGEPSTVDTLLLWLDRFDQAEESFLYAGGGDTVEAAKQQLSAFTAPAESEDATAPLLPVVQVLKAKATTVMFPELSCKAALSDLTGDGVPELITSYTWGDGLYVYLEVWSEQNGTPALLWDDLFYVNAGAAAGDVRVITTEQGEFLCVYDRDTRRGEMSPINRGTLRLLALSDEGAYETTQIFQYTFPGSDHRTMQLTEQENKALFSLNGRSSAFGEFEALTSTLDLVPPFLSTEVESPAGLSLEDAALQLANAEN